MLDDGGGDPGGQGGGQIPPTGGGFGPYDHRLPKVGQTGIYRGYEGDEELYAAIVTKIYPVAQGEPYSRVDVNVTYGDGKWKLYRHMPIWGV